MKTPNLHQQLFAAIDDDNLDRVIEIASKNDVTLWQNSIGEPPLVNAARRNNEKIVKGLIPHLKHLNGQDGMGMTALHQAAIFCRPHLVEILSDAGADMTIRDMNGKTAAECVPVGIRQRPETKDAFDKALKKMAEQRQKAEEERVKKLSSPVLKKNVATKKIRLRK